MSIEAIREILLAKAIESGKTKVCRSCKEEKHLSRFRSDRNKCRNCESTIAKQHNKINKEAIKARRPKHKEKELAYAKEYRQRDYVKVAHVQAAIKHQEENPDKRRAQQLIYRAVRDGSLIRPNNCSNCHSNKTKIEAHHEDYSKPFDVIWLFKDCHTKTHLNSVGKVF